MDWSVKTIGYENIRYENIGYESMPYISSSTLYFHIYYIISQLKHCDKTTANSALEKDKNWTIKDGFTIGLSFLKKKKEYF